MHLRALNRIVTFSEFGFIKIIFSKQDGRYKTETLAGNREIGGKQKVKDEAWWNQRKEVKERMD